MQVTAPARIGGLETVVLQLASGLLERGVDIRVAAVLTPGDEHGHPFLEALRAAAVPHETLLLNSRAYLSEAREIRRLVHRFGVNVLHTHGYRADILHGLSARMLGIRHVMTLHGFVSANWRDRLYEKLQIGAARSAGATIAVSDPIAHRLHEAGVRSNVVLLRNALGPALQPYSRENARATLGVPREASLVGWIGRLSEEKGPDVFIEAIAHAAAHIHGVIVGDGPMRESLVLSAQRLGVSDRVHFVGALSQARRYLHGFDTLALTSRTEGTPMVMLEAMHAGIPIVTTMVGGIPDIVSEREAWCCEAGDARGLALAFADAVVETADVRSRVGKAHSLVTTRFALDAWLDEHERLYASL